MSMGAMCLVSVVVTGFAAPSVFQRRHRFEMLWIDTAADAAEVVNLHPIWDLSHQEIVRNSMRALYLAITAKKSITLVVHGT